MGSCQAYGLGHKFSKILIFCWKAKILPLATIISVVVFEMAGSLVDFWKQCLQNSQVAYRSFFQTKMVFCVGKKVIILASTLNNYTNVFLDTNTFFCIIQKCCGILPIFVTRNILKRSICKSTALGINNFYFFIKNIKWNCHFY